MKGTLLYTVTGTDRIRNFHYCAFHGEAQRRDVPGGKDPSHSLGDDLSEPLLLSRNGMNVPDVFMPRSSLIVSDMLRGKLEPIGLSFLQVIMKKVVAYEYQAGDMSYFRTRKFMKNPRAHDPETLIARLPDVPALRMSLSSYHEVIAPRLERIVADYPTATSPVPFDVIIGGGEERTCVHLCCAMLSKYGIVRVSGTGCGPAHVLSQQAFEVMEPYLDWDYFVKSTSEVQ